ncbi:MAG: translocation/assembly module TamB domain-containing protein [Methylococcales bacterium]|nr:translocation/assembly module TamB domain-containing protein [Methylococcales bacterium]
MKFFIAHLWQRKVIRISTYCGLGLLISALLLVILLQLPFVQKQIAQTLSQTLSDDAVHIKLSPIEGFFPFDIQFSNFSLADKQGVWLELEDVQLKWSLTALLTGEIQIDALEAKRLWIKRLPPALPPEKEDATGLEIPTTLPEINLDLPIINVQQLGINDIRLEQAVIGQALNLKFTANAQTVGQKIKAKLQLKRTDQASLTLNLDAQIHLNPLTLTTQLDLDETGGILAALSQQPELKKLKLSLTTAGLLTNLKVNLKTDIEGIGQLKTDIQLGLTEQPWLNLKTDLHLQAGLLNADIIDLIGQKQQLQLNVIAANSYNVALKHLTFDNKLIGLNSQATIDLSTQNIEAQVNLKLSQLKKLTTLTGIKLSGESELNLKAEGLLSAPKINVKARVKNLKVDDLSLQALKLNLDLAPLKTLAEAQFNIALQGTATDLKQNGQSLPESNLSWQLVTTVDENKRFNLRKLNVEGEWSHLHLAGIFDSQQQQGDLKLNLVVDHLKAVTSVAKANIKAAATIKIHPKVEKITIDLKTDLLQLSGLDAEINQLLGQQVHLSSTIEVIPNQQLKIKRLAINTKALNLKAKTTLNLKNQQLKGKVTIAIPYFKNKDLHFKRALVDLTIAGSSKKPKLTLLATLPELTVANQNLNGIKLHVKANDVLDKLTGKLTLNLKHYQQPFAIKTAYGLKKQQLTLNNILIKAPKTTLKGDLSVDLSTTQLQGKLTATSDLSGFKPWLDKSLIKGSLALNADFKPIQGKQSVQLKARLKRFKLDELSLKTLTFDAEINDALNTPKLNARVHLKELKQQQTQLDDLKLTALGVLEQLNVQLAVQGEHQQPFNLSVTATVKQKDQQTQLHLQRITGKLAKQKIKLEHLSTLTLTPKKITLSPLSLFIGKAHLKGQVNYSKELVAGNLKLDFPLSFINQWVKTPLKGDFKTEVTLSGTGKQPQIELALNLNDLGLNEEDYEKIPATQIALTTQFKQQQLSAQVEMRNPQFKKPLHLALQLPMRLQLEPFNFKLPEDKALQGQLTADLNLKDLTKNIPIEGQKLAGDFKTRLNLTGTLKKPELNGRVSLEQGDYQNAITETHLKNIRLHIDAKPKQIRLTELRVEDNEKGTINGKGLLTLATDSTFPFQGELNINHIQLANSPQLRTHLSGNIYLKGNEKKSLLSGQLSIDDFHFTLPSISSSQEAIPELEVIEIGKGRPSVKKQLAIKQVNNKKEFDMQLDVGVKMANQFYIKGYGLESEWQGDLTIKGDASMPKVLGLIQIKKGTLEILNNRFAFRQGLIDFNGAYPPLPSLDIETVANTDEGEAFVRIKGMADNPQLELSHNPTRPQDEILSYLLFKENTKSISPMQALQLADVITMLASGGLTNIDTLGNLQTGLGLDRLNLGGDSFDTASVKAGKYITDKIYLEVEQGLQSESSTATVEVDLLPDIKAEVEFNQNSDSAIGIKWKHDY